MYADGETYLVLECKNCIKEKRKCFGKLIKRYKFPNYDEGYDCSSIPKITLIILLNFFSLEKCDREESCKYWTHTSTVNKYGYCSLYKNCNFNMKYFPMSTSGAKGCPHNTGETKRSSIISLQNFIRKLPKGLEFLSYHFNVLQILQKKVKLGRCSFFL